MKRKNKTMLMKTPIYSFLNQNAFYDAFQLWWKKCWHKHSYEIQINISACLFVKKMSEFKGELKIMCGLFVLIFICLLCHVKIWLLEILHSVIGAYLLAKRLQKDSLPFHFIVWGVYMLASWIHFQRSNQIVSMH